MNEAIKKPPIGIIPEWRHKELRLEEIREGMARYYKEGVEVPAEWIIEDEEICHYLRMRTLKQSLKHLSP